MTALNKCSITSVSSFTFFRKPKLVPTPEGIEFPKNVETGKSFPLCCTYHTEFYNRVKSYFDQYPNCCNRHKVQYDTMKIDKTAFKGLEDRVLNCYYYTIYYISTYIHEDNWYKEITDYIVFIIESFGSPAVGLIHYLQAIEAKLKDSKEIDDFKKRVLIEFISTYYNNQQFWQITDIKKVYTYYNNWLSLMPLDLPVFNKIRHQMVKPFENFASSYSYNKHLKYNVSKFHSEYSFLDELQITTKRIFTYYLNEILANKDCSTEDLLSIDLIRSKAVFNNSLLLNNYSEGEHLFIDLIRDWYRTNTETLEELVQFETHRKRGEIIIDEKPENNVTKLKVQLCTYDFESLEKTKKLSDSSKNILYKTLSIKHIKYKIRMLDYLGFFENYNSYFNTKTALYKALAQILSSNERDIRGYLLKLSPVSGENKKYDSTEFKKIVEMDFESIRMGEEVC